MSDRTADVVVVGSGGRPYREYSFQALAERYRVSAVLPSEPTWQRAYLARWAVADLGDEPAVTAALAELAGPGSGAGVFTWVETALEVTARAAEKLSLRHMSAAAVANCRDKYRARTLLDAAGLPTVRHSLVHSADEAERAADAIGYPLVVKPRALAGSIGVVLARDAGELRDGFALAAGAAYHTLPTGHGVLVEEYLRGPEISVESVVRDGEVRCVHVARKRLGFAPHFEEVGHLVAGWSHEPWAEGVRELLAAVHRALGVDVGVTHAEVRLTDAGPRLVELNARLGGDLIPLAGRLSTGIDLVLAAAELSLGRAPDLSPRRDRCAEIRFCYPPHDGTVHRVDVAAAAAADGIAQAAAIAEPGTTLLLPPRQAVPRLAVLVAAGADPAACEQALEAAAPLVDADVAPLAGTGRP